jgi:hypothetical protein
MAKKDYIIANKRWLEEKAKEEGVLALPQGIYYKVLKSGDPTVLNLHVAVSSQPTIRDGQSMEKNLIRAEEVLLLLCG